MAISITPLSGGNTPADGSDPRTFPAIWNATASDLESEILPNGVSSPSDGELLAYDSGTSEWVNQALESAQLPAGSVLQVVRATDTADRTTSSSSFTDTGLSVTITPTSASSLIYVMSSCLLFTQDASSTGTQAFLQITDSSDVALDGAEESALFLAVGGASAVTLRAQQGLIGFDSPGSTSAQTYKLRFKQGSSTTTTIENASNTGQLIAIEVAA